MKFHVFSIRLFIGRARITKALHFFFSFNFYSCSVFFAEKMWEEKSKLIENLIEVFKTENSTELRFSLIFRLA